MAAPLNSPSSSTARRKAPHRIRYSRPWLAPYQTEAIFCPERYALIEASTKAGKTAGCLVWLNEQTMMGREGQSFWWVAPVHRQALIAYRRMKRGLPREIYVANDTEQRVTLLNGASMWFLSAEKPDNLYGDDVYAAVIDEASRCREESFHAVRSTLTATKGPLRAIGNVKGRSNWFYRTCREAQHGAPDMHYAKITALDAVAAGILDQAEIDDAKRRLPKHVFDELYLAEAADQEGRVYKNFSYAENVSSEVSDLGGDLLVGMDFNVDPMSAVLCSRAADELHVFGEIIMRNGSTEEMAREIRQRYPERRVKVYPDPSGRARKTSAPVGQTDFTILERSGFQVLAPRAAPAVVDRINEVNALCVNADGRRRLYVHPDCVVLIEGLEDLVYKEGTSQPDKSLGIDHAPDGLGYLVHMEFPIGGKSATRRRSMF